MRNIPDRGFKALSALSLKPFCVPSALKHANLPEVNPISVTPINSLVPVRTVTKFSLKTGKRKSVKVVPTRFLRLRWGGWIHTRCGRHKKLYKKSANLKRRLRQHVMVNSQQATLLDKMVTSFWRRPKHYADDLYEPYHERDYYFASRKPMPYPEHPLKSPKSFLELSKGKY